MRCAAAIAMLVLVAPVQADNDQGEKLVDALAERWSGVFDTAEQLVYREQSQSDIASNTDERRVRTIVVRVPVP